MIDDHAHPFSLEGGPLNVSALSLDIEADPDGRRDRLGPGRVFQELVTTRLAKHLGCHVEDLPAARVAAGADWPAYVSGLFAEAGLSGLVMDPAYPLGSADRLGDYARLTGCTVHALLRIDPVIDRMIGEDAAAADIVDAVKRAMEEASARGFVGFKTVLAYRTGLEVDPDVTPEQAEASLRSDVPVRRRGKALRDLVLREALGLAADLGKPFQIHTGLGDSEIRLAEANPLLLEELLRSPAGQAARIVLIHGSFPWLEELAFLAATKANVWADYSLANIFSPLTVSQQVLRLVDLAPADKVLMGTDGHHEPELFWFAARVLREAWDGIRDRLAEAGARPSWVDHVELRMFEENARELYGL